MAVSGSRRHFSIPTRRGLTINDLVTQIDHQRQGNLSSAIRVFLLEESLRAAAQAAPVSATAA